MHGDREREHGPEHEVPAEQVVAARRQLGPLDHPTPESSVAATTVTAAAPAAVRRSQRAGSASRRHTRRSFQPTTPASAKPPTPCTANTQASPLLAGEQGHHAGREQQPDEQRQAPVVDRAVTAPESVLSPEPSSRSTISDRSQARALRSGGPSGAASDYAHPRPGL